MEGSTGSDQVDEAIERQGADVDRLLGELATAKGEIVQLRQQLAEIAGDDLAAARGRLERARAVIEGLHETIVTARDAANLCAISAAHMPPYDLGRIYEMTAGVPELEDLLAQVDGAAGGAAEEAA